MKNIEDQDPPQGGINYNSSTAIVADCLSVWPPCLNTLFALVCNRKVSSTTSTGLKTIEGMRTMLAGADDDSVGSIILKAKVCVRYE